ncbi:hypothetical protein [Ferviditalea candida]|uniref:DUF4397 domain-containing protein n=1 Tax=Ferviditalea candida TaxID=3108399 RepID=A0ABU5ZDJ4_9BACL|nr:hypothetical protein [Paenibacillaceae bacterium T2]
MKARLRISRKHSAASIRKLRKSNLRSSAGIRGLTVFSFTRISPNTFVYTTSFTVARLFNTGEVIVSQRPATGSTAIPTVRYQFVNAITNVPVTNFVTVSGTRISVLRFVLPPGTFKLKITNVGSGPVEVEGVILVF